ncbi:biofilm regulation protein phosphatase SiaA [Halomonas icarae]|uniref:SpoIIE family protein phosphatase n=1 Tax=Halomonas icarae TaxID=2691040 RepID=A0A7X5AK63_9GAMM|nr:biofilm regulation protein phosphatase SiaA [Halomonas icarae]MDR5901065.1 biofilm regulation protein phosphatase SiaA [Halomonas icarae]NAW11341.1 SpoIIE family protein phosphatase [Halomonas icarae]
MAYRWGLRGQSTLSLLLACLLALIPALLIGWQALDSARHHFATRYAEQYTLLHMQRILAPVSRELALSRRFADSVVTREWLAAPDDATRRDRFFREAEGFRSQFSGEAYFIVNHGTGNYYFNDDVSSESHLPRYRIDPDDPDNAWYFATMAGSNTYNINVNLDAKLGLAKVWLNVKIMDGDRPLGLAGGGLDLSRFLNDFMRSSAQGLTPLIIDARGAIQAHPDRNQLALSSGALTELSDDAPHLQALLGSDAQRERLESAMREARLRPGEVQVLDAELKGEPRLLSVGYIPELQWLLVTALDLKSAPLIDSRWLLPLASSLLLVFLILLAGFTYGIERLVLAPLRRLQHSAQAIADGDYGSRLPVERSDEIGELSRAFSHMAAQIEHHTQELEEKVRQRTQALESSNAQMIAARRQIDASLEYASIIQRAILPDRQMARHLADQHAVLWRPRDQVGGDFYIFHATDSGYLMGVVDCAGHGVPGALMTMLARAIIDHAIRKVGADDPAGILNETHRQSRETLHHESLPASIATNMDIGLVWIEHGAGQLTFAGAKLSLYASDGEELAIYSGGRRALGQRRAMTYENRVLPLHDHWTYSLCSDGFLDQAGGEHGFGFGNARFEKMLKRHAATPLDQQIARYEAELDAYRGQHSQRDDVTLLCFRFTPAEPADT